jgi:vesicle-fusing ATPase
VVKNASSFAMTQGNDIMDFSKQLEIKAGTAVTQNNFRKALQEVIPGFGMDQVNFEVYVRNPLVNYGQNYGNIVKMLDKMTNLTLKGSRQLTSVLLYGPPGSGKTSIASHYAKDSKFTYVKIITPEKYIGVGTYGRIFSFNKVFNDAYKAKESLIIIDNIERLVEYVATGPDFNNTLMQALTVLIKKIPENPDCRLMIVGSTSNLTALDLLDIDKVFGVKVKIPLLNRTECACVLGCDLNIENVAVKRLVNFKEICADKPKSVWGKLWSKYSA